VRVPSLAGPDQARLVRRDISPGEFTSRFPGSSLADNARSAAGKPTVAFETDIVAQ
jgi:hypothetical protein